MLRRLLMVSFLWSTSRSSKLSNSIRWSFKKARLLTFLMKRVKMFFEAMLKVSLCYRLLLAEGRSRAWSKRSLMTCFLPSKKILSSFLR